MSGKKGKKQEGSPLEQKAELGGSAVVRGNEGVQPASAAVPVPLSNNAIKRLKKAKRQLEKEEEEEKLKTPPSPSRSRASKSGGVIGVKSPETPVSAAELKATKRSDFDAYHTDALFAWGFDYGDGWTLTKEASRVEILEELVTRAQVPTSREAIELAWVKCYGLKRPYLEKGDEDGDIEESEEEEEVAEEPNPAKRQRVDVPVSSPPFTLPAISQDDILRYLIAQAASSTIKIPSSVAVTESQELIRARALVAAANASTTCAATTATAGTSAASTATPRVDSDELECQRLIATGEPYPLFENRTTIAATKAAQILRGAFGGVRYAQVAEPRLALVRSGKMINPCYVVPLMAGSEERQAPISRACDYRDAADARPVLARGRAINNIHECILAGFTIMAALAEQPEAMFNWMALLASVVRLDKEKSWAVAHGYLLRVLQDKVPSRLDFGAYDSVCGNSAIQDGMQSEQATHYASVRDAIPIPSMHQNSGDPCWGFNSISGCRFGDGCRHTHKCSNDSCPDRYANRHNALSCPNRSTSSVRSAPTVRFDLSSRGGRGGRGNRRGGRGGYSGAPPNAE